MLEAVVRSDLGVAGEAVVFGALDGGGFEEPAEFILLKRSQCLQ